jgi:hypothetical protein
MTVPATLSSSKNCRQQLKGKGRVGPQGSAGFARSPGPSLPVIPSKAESSSPGTRIPGAKFQGTYSIALLSSLTYLASHCASFHASLPFFSSQVCAAFCIIYITYHAHDFFPPFVSIEAPSSSLPYHRSPQHYRSNIFNFLEKPPAIDRQTSSRLTRSATIHSQHPLE